MNKRVLGTHGKPMEREQKKTDASFFLTHPFFVMIVFVD